ncbi:MAG: 16S rRNA (cytosine(1402)-N(4))-methyltransferase RsmH [Lactobacillales bacterium]|jgi:16S rRNA (cytosine1402-N4)-methyltransferase|nr:16S rRNA (cytosine(1402)-N(4))-methyltransferase RsmH [Lactobacillales bacterium]
MAQKEHIPVLLKEVLDSLNPAGGIYVDGTFGAGGYTEAILRAHPENTVYAFDRDPHVMETARVFKEKYGGRFHFIADRFSNMAAHIVGQVQGIVLDIGVSSMQIDTAGRGFSFRLDGPLDMRMTPDGETAADVVNTYPEKKIADILYEFGEEKASFRIARAIVSARARQKITTTKALAEVIHGVMPRPKDGSDSAMRSFQALRVFVNKELDELQTALDASIGLLSPGGRLVVVSFHSLEDRIVKNFFIQNSDLRPNQNRHLPAGAGDPVFFRVLTKKALTATPAELESNPRSHSAKLRAAQRLKGDI